MCTRNCITFWISPGFVQVNPQNSQLKHTTKNIARFPRIPDKNLGTRSEVLTKSSPLPLTMLIIRSNIFFSDMGGWEIRDVVQVSQLLLTSINYNSTHDFRRKKIALVKMQTLDLISILNSLRGTMVAQRSSCSVKIPPQRGSCVSKILQWSDHEGKILT